MFTSGGLNKGVATGHREWLGRGLTAGLAGGLIYGLAVAATLALSLGLAYWLVKIDNMRPDAQWQWSWRRIRGGMDIAVAIGLAVGLTHALANVFTHPSPLAYQALIGLGHGLIIGLGGGLIVGFAFGLVDIETNRPAARWHWSPYRLSLALLATAIYGSIQWLLFVQGVKAIMGPDKGPVFILLIGLTFWLTFGLGYGHVPDRNLPPPAPARALAASLRAVVVPMFMAASLTLLGVFIAKSDVIDYVHIILFAPAALAGLITFWFTGGGAWHAACSRPPGQRASCQACPAADGHDAPSLRRSLRWG